MRENQARLSVVFGPETTIATIEIKDVLGNWRSFGGDAKKHPNDDPDAVVGEAYAISRALRAAAEHFKNLADGKVAANWVLEHIVVTRLESK